MVKKILFFTLSLLILFSLCSCNQVEDSEKTATKETSSDKSVVVNVGDTVYLGHYEQDNNAEATEPIEWYVVDANADEDKVLILCKNVIDAIPFHSEKSELCWNNSEIRKWLNEDFYSIAFTDEEKEFIRETELENPANSNYETPGCANTKDKVFFLSLQEANKYFTDGHYMLYGIPTTYAQSKGIYVGGDYQGHGCSWWWLRSPGNKPDTAAAIAYNGSINEYGLALNHQTSNGVRPAMWVNAAGLESANTKQ